MGVLPVSTITNDPRFAPGLQPTHVAALPQVSDLDVHEPALIDRFGDQVRDRWPVIAGSGIAGIALGAVTRGGLGALAGGILGATLAMGFGMATAHRSVETSAARAGAATADPSVRTSEALRVMSINLHGGMGPEGAEGSDGDKLDRLARYIETQDPDVVLVQEADLFAPRSNRTDTLGELARRLHADGAVAVAPATRLSGHQEATGVLTFNGTTVADARGIVAADPHGDGSVRRMLASIGRAPDHHPRSTTEALVTTPGGTNIRVMSAHDNWQMGDIDPTDREVAPVAAAIGEWSGPTIYGGDFNVEGASASAAKEARFLGDVGLRDAFTERGIPLGDARRATFGSGTPSEELDRIYASRHFEAHDARVVDFPADEPEPSDHRAVVVDYRLAPAD